MKSSRYSKFLIFTGVLVLALSASPTGMAQTVPTLVQCGTILEAELRSGDDEHRYTIELRAGDTLNIRVEEIGETFISRALLYDPVGNYIDDSYGRNASIARQLAASGTYTILVRPQRNVGAYTLLIGCTLRTGPVIAPGDVPSNAQPVTQPAAPTELSPDFVGFRGLAPVDFASVIPFSIPPGVPMTGGITPAGGEILGYVVSGNAGDVLELHFTRLSGNLNLGLVVLSQNNELAFQASLITTSSLTTQLTLPSTGEYTVGVFRVDLLPPGSPGPTTFQIQAVVNP